MERERILDLLATVADPEIPALNIVEMGVVREVVVENGKVRVDLTPTYTGCPALEWIRREVRRVLAAAGVEALELRTVLTPVWTTDGWSEATRAKLRREGVAPPPPPGGEVTCPRCGAGTAATECRSPFGPTPCLALHYCRRCAQPFLAFKRH